MGKLAKLFFRHEALVRNFSFLSLVQITNMLLPLITYPYLIRVLGSENFGKIVYCQAIVGYFVVVVSFGFNATATRDISKSLDDQDVVNEIVSSVYYLRSFLVVISAGILMILSYFTDLNRGVEILFLLSFWSVFYELLFPVFYFQAVEKMGVIAVANLLSKIMYLIAILIFVNSKEDYLLVPVINGIGAVFVSAFAIYLMLREGVKFRIVSIGVLWVSLKNSLVMALAYSSNALKSSFSSVIIRGIFSFNEVAYFDLAVKVVNLGNSFLEVINRSIFPKMSREKDGRFLKKVIYLSVLISGLYSCCIFFCAELVIDFLGGENMKQSVVLLKMLALVPPLYIIASLLGRNCLIVHGKDTDVLKSMLYSGVSYMMCVFIAYRFTDFTIKLLTFLFMMTYAFEAFYRFYRVRKGGYL